MHQSGKFRFRHLDTVGSSDAENDDFLEKCFMDVGYLEVLEDCRDPRRIVLGRTGSGKSAILLQIKARNERSVLIKPESLALSYVSNSTIIRYLLEIGVNLDVFFRLLWRHVFAVELLQHRFQLQDEKATRSFFDRFRQNQQDKRLKEALDYLETWGKSFWKETDYRIKEVTSNLESEVTAGVQAVVPTFKADLGAAHNLKDETKAEIVHRAQHVVDQVQIRELGEVIDLLDELLDDDQKQYYLIVDKLDEDWVDDGIRYKLIRALIETIKDFNKVQNAKIIIALREDLLRRVFERTRSGGFQQEKYESLCAKIVWTKHQLKDILDLRIQELIRRRYTKQPVSLLDILPSTINRFDDPVDYILDRTLLRPRDAILFLNLALRRADRKASLNSTILKDAEREYSSKRFSALCDEWFSDYASLKRAAEILKGRKDVFAVKDISIEECQELAYTILTDNTDSSPPDKIYQLAESNWESDAALVNFRKNLVSLFFNVGILGIKLRPNERFVFVNDTSRDIWNPEVDEEMKVTVHPAFQTHLNIRPSK